MPKITINNVRVPSINHKYGFSPRSKRLFLDPKYAAFKSMISAEAKRQIGCTLKPPYLIVLNWYTYHDIENSIKCILDGLEDSGVISNDREVLRVEINKIPRRRGELNDITIQVDTVDFMGDSAGAILYERRAV